MGRRWRSGQISPRAIPRQGGLTGAHGDDLVEGNELAIEALGSGAEHPDSGIRAFAYLWRRFGPPRLGSDDHKDLAGYTLRTPDPRVFLSLTPSAVALAMDVGYLAHESFREELNRARTEWWDRFLFRMDIEISARHGITGDDVELSKQHPNWPAAMAEFEEVRWQPHHVRIIPMIPVEDTLVNVPRGRPRGKNRRKMNFGVRLWRQGPPPMRQVNEALFAALRDLLRPVNVQGVRFNILGRDPKTFRGPEAPNSPLAGLGIDHKPLHMLKKGT